MTIKCNFQYIIPMALYSQKDHVDPSHLFYPDHDTTVSGWRGPFWTSLGIIPEFCTGAFSLGEYMECRIGSGWYSVPCVCALGIYKHNCTPTLIPTLTPPRMIYKIMYIIRENYYKFFLESLFSYLILYSVHMSEFCHNFQIDQSSFLNIISIKDLHVCCSRSNILYIPIIMCTFGVLWRHNGHDGVPNHQPHYYLMNCLFRRRWKETSKLRVTGLCEGNSPVIGEFPAKIASNAEIFSIWWRHNDTSI